MHAYSLNIDHCFIHVHHRKNSEISLNVLQGYLTGNRYRIV